MFVTKLLKQVSSVVVGAFSCYSVLTSLPYLLNKINVIKVVMVIPELFKLDKHSCNKQEHFIPYIYLYLYRYRGLLKCHLCYIFSYSL